MKKGTSGLSNGANGNRNTYSATIISFMAKFTSMRTCPRQRGFTLIELLVTLAVAAVLASLAAPSIRDFIVRSKMTNIGNEFTGSVLRARNEAVNRNICVTLCMSGNVTSATPSCSTTGTDWQAGWISFINPECDSSLGGPKDADAAATDMLLVHQSAGADFQLITAGSTRKMMFNPRGAPGTGSAGLFKLLHAENAFSEKFGYNICLDGMGRTRTLPHLDDCSSYK